MERHWNYDRFIAILNQEIILLGKIFKIQNAVREAVLAQEWTDFDWKIAEINQIGRDFADLDKERVSLFMALALQMDISQAEMPPFYALAAKLPEDEKIELSRLYRIIKMETLKMQALSDSFLNYISEVRATASAYLEAALPDRGGKMYTSRGMQTGQDLKSIVFNRHI